MEFFADFQTESYCILHLYNKTGNATLSTLPFYISDITNHYLDESISSFRGFSGCCQFIRFCIEIPVSKQFRH